MNLDVRALGATFYPNQISVRTRSRVTIEFFNDDSAVNHDLSVRSAAVPAGPSCTGPCRARYSFVAPAPGNYELFCTVHPYITGKLIVEP
jgi:plastocyanin